jgi:hypothetical protein
MPQSKVDKIGAMNMLDK